MSDRAPSIDRPRVEPRRQGFTIIEVLFALIILTFGVLGLASTTLWVVRQTQVSEVATERTIALQSVIEELRAAPYNDVVAGSGTEGNFSVSWTVAVGANSKLVTVTTTGPGLVNATGFPTLSPSVAQTFDYRIFRR
jgi:prepilin-type N-terminal cleavage/methylation domain-containing protein